VFTTAETAACNALIALGLKEDLDECGDLTSQAVIPANLQGRAIFVARSGGVAAGLPIVPMVLAAVESQMAFQPLVEDGASLEAGGHLAIVSGPMRGLLTAERLTLNFLQHLSGVATLTRRYVDAIAGLSCRILDTRKTIPGWRLLDKYAVRCGGGHNHRLGLYDGVLIKDNHLAALAGTGNPLTEAVDLARNQYGNAVPLEIEVDNLAQLDIALAAGPDIVLLDNMSVEQMREAVRRRNATAPGVLLEASGGVTLATLRSIAETAVDRISVGALTHSAPALDIALDYLA
jgi:nicotinate-nucleotide pyrophosphorylase (carboxylating)